MSASDEQSQGPVIRDRRRIDPVTGQVRETGQSGDADTRSAGPPRPGKHAASKPGRPRQGAAGTGGAGQAAATTVPAGAAGGDRAAAGPDGAAGAAGQDKQRPAADNGLAVKLAERTADLQRLQAEYANYRKRVDRDRAAVREMALAGVLAELIPVLDDIGRAREHGELTGGFKAIADALESAAVKLGLITFGEAGEPFDPNVHEALMHSYSPDVTEPTCVQVLQPGYKVGERILRAARVAVAEPTDPAGARTDGDAAPEQAEGAPDQASTADDDSGAGEPTN